MNWKLNRSPILTPVMCIMILLLSSHAGQAQSSLPQMVGDSAEGILNIARQYGSAAITRQPNGDPLIAGRIDNIPYALRFLNCAGRDACEDVNFRVGFQVKPSPEIINSWNASKRFSRAYLDGEGDAILEMDAIIDGGVSTQAMSSTFAYWRLSLAQFMTHIGFQ